MLEKLFCFLKKNLLEILTQPKSKFIGKSIEVGIINTEYIVEVSSIFVKCVYDRTLFLPWHVHTRTGISLRFEEHISAQRESHFLSEDISIKV